MTHLQSLLDRLGWSHRHAGTLVGVSASPMRYWAQGVNTRGNVCPPPGWVVDYFERCAAALDAVPVRKPK
jgi:hypothetical protein